MQAHVEILVGPMGSGKTTHLQTRVAEHRISGRKVGVVKHTRDTRWHAQGYLQTHDNKRTPADLQATTAREVTNYALREALDVVAIDEGQFFDDIAKEADHMASVGITVIIAALDSNL